jgi:hypothetical protein
MFDSTLRRLAALLCAVVPLISLAGLFAVQHDCACGMSRDACFCELTMGKVGARCHMGGREKCSMRPAGTPSGTALFISFDLRGWLQMRGLPENGGPAVTPAGTVALVDFGAPRSFPLPPEPPPPRVFRSA